jgi:5-methylcytosine-specific restriction endonuclease McrA
MARADLNTGKWKHLRRAVLNRDQHTCAYCGKEATQVDHVVPVSAGGSQDMDNLVAACAPCNNAKGGVKQKMPRFFEAHSTALSPGFISLPSTKLNPPTPFGN